MTGEEAKLWAKERCERGEELPNEPVSEIIVFFKNTSMLTVNVFLLNLTDGKNVLNLGVSEEKD